MNRAVNSTSQFWKGKERKERKGKERKGKKKKREKEKKEKQEKVGTQDSRVVPRVMSGEL